MAKKSKTIGSMWNKARETTQNDTGDFIPLDVGVYNMQIVHAEIGEYGKDRKLYCKYAVVDEGDDRGKICHDWDAIDDEERMVWVQRKLIALGIDLEELEIETEDDLIAAVQECIEECVVVRVKVTEKDGFTNMRVQKQVEWEEEDLFDPEGVLNGNTDSDEDEDEEDEEDETEESETKYEYNEGDMLMVEYDGEDLEAEVIAGGDESIKVRYTDDDEEEVIKASRISSRIEDDDDDNETGEAELEKDSRVIVTIKGKERAGVVKSLNKAKGSCRIVLDHNGKTHEFPQDEVDFEIDD